MRHWNGGLMVGLYRWLAGLGWAVLVAQGMAVEQLHCPTPISVAFFEFGKQYRTGEDGKAVGVDKDLIEEVSRRSGCQFESRVQSRVRIWRAMEVGSLDMTLSSAATPERERLAWFIPYIADYLNFFIRADLNELDGLAAFEANPALRVAILRGARYSKGYDDFVDRLRLKGRVEDLTTMQAGFAKFRAGRVHGFIAPGSVGKELLREGQLQHQFLPKLWDTEATIVGAIAMSKQRMTETQYQQLSTIIKAIRQDGTFRTILLRHSNESVAANSEMLLKQAGR
ncbi:polar amino acid transport system substrate-binding protein [Chitinivorax tropicus]|uniref:Polar amino acid transport system substrate-binding protein n=1 Tax=Chitinivorax tropicus TaxID=714531 RepID=A0A840MMP1_9PROT|nr:transporter substrate-binding domain-containing protein [Chitinivorax tropicus]MBB5019908.1 polar amino acid transport system substrate-binding protein [Chitinivorax tropicus]